MDGRMSVFEVASDAAQMAALRSANTQLFTVNFLYGYEFVLKFYEHDTQCFSVKQEKSDVPNPRTNQKLR